MDYSLYYTLFLTVGGNYVAVAISGLVLSFVVSFTSFLIRYRRGSAYAGFVD